MEKRFLRIASALEHVAQACDFVLDAARAAGLDERAQRDCYLAVDEACTNIIQHGYPTECETCVIDIECHLDDAQLTILICDHGIAFNPLALPQRDAALTVEEYPPGGWGIFFIRKLMDEASYIYSEGQNQLTLIKRRGSQPKAASNTNTPHISIAPLGESTWLLTVQGRIDTRAAPELEAAFNHLLESRRAALVIDCARLDYISSAGIKIIVGAWQRARELRGDVVLAALPAHIRDWLHLVGLDLVLTMTDNVEAARLILISNKRR